MDDANDQQVALIAQLPVQMPTNKPWSQGLGKLLLQEADDGGGVSDRASGGIRLIAINPKLRAEAERLLPVLEDMKAPAHRDEITAVIMREMPAWGVPLKTAGVMGVTFASYTDALEEFSLYMVEEAVVRWNAGQAGVDVKSAGFPPRPAQLALLAQDARREVFMAKYRCEKALAYVEAVVPRISEEERRERGAQLRDLLGELGANRKPNPLEDTRPRLTPQEVAAQLLARAEQNQPQDVGDVI